MTEHRIPKTEYRDSPLVRLLRGLWHLLRESAGEIDYERYCIRALARENLRRKPPTSTSRAWNTSIHARIVVAKLTMLPGGMR